MPTITRLVAGKRNPNRVNIYLDGHFALAISIDEVGKRGLAKGQSLSEAAVTELKESDQQVKLYGKILNFISYRPRSVQEVRDRLKKYDLTDPSSQNKLITRLQTQGYLDDLAFAHWFLESRAHNRPRSARHLAAELRAHGVGSDIITEVLKSVDESSALDALIRKYAHSLDRQHLLAYLARRGFSYGYIQAKLDEMGISE